MSSDDAEFVEKSDGALFRTPCSFTRNGGSVHVRPHEHWQISDTALALESEGKSKKGLVAAAYKKWKVVLWYRNYIPHS
jgi:hypothetical protein